MPRITDEHKAFSVAVVDLARAHNMDNLTMNFRFGWGHEKDPHQMWGEVKMQWEEPREGQAEVHISATERHNVKINR